MKKLQSILRIIQMTYDKQDLIDKSLKAIKENNLTFITEVPPFIGIRTSTFYDKEMEKTEEIKDAILENRLKTARSMKAKWYKSKNATLQVALMKLICTEEEAHRLNGSKREVKQEVINHSSVIEELERDDLLDEGSSD